jgi:hypothetical protein
MSSFFCYITKKNFNKQWQHCHVALSLAANNVAEVALKKEEVDVVVLFGGCGM